jgi:hypothetical protein
LLENLEQLERINIFDIPGQKKWKRKIRGLMHRIIGYERIEAKINNTLSMMKILDAKISCYAKEDRR